MKAKPDEVFSYGPLKIARFGRFIQLVNTSTPKEHTEFLKRTAEAHKEVIPKLVEEITFLQSSIQKYDPIELMHRAAYMLLPLFLKYKSENEFTSHESYFLPTVEYLQYLISRTPLCSGGKAPDESEWNELWSSATKVLNLTQGYLFTRRTISTPPTEIDELRFMVDGRRLMIRVSRYPIYFADHLRDSLLSYEDSIKDAYGINISQLIQGMEEINEYQKTGVPGRYITFRDATEAIMQKLWEHGYSLEAGVALNESDRIKEALGSSEFASQYDDIQEKARLTLTTAIFDITDITSLPHPILNLLSIRPGEAILTTLTGPNHDDLSPLSTSIFHYKPFVEKDGRFYFFYHSGFEDRVAEIIENDLFARFPARESSMRRRRDEYIESLSTDLLVSILKPDIEHRNLYYPNPDKPGDVTELDALLSLDDILFLVEIKAGGFSAAANRGAPESLYDELSDTIGMGQRQSERAEKYIKSADEVSFFDATGRREIHRVKHTEFRQIFRIVVTREDLGWVGARIAILSMLDPSMSMSFPWHVSLDDLRVVVELFKDSELRFVHYLEQRLKASSETALSQHDEIEHIGLYNKINLYHELPVQGMDSFSFDPSYMRDIDFYFSERYCGESPELPMQKIPTKLAELMHALKESQLSGRFEVASIILSMDEVGRNQLEDALKHLDLGKEQGKQLSVRMPFTGASYGLTISYAKEEFWQQELVRSAAQQEQGSCARWLAVQLNNLSPYTISRIERILPGRFSDGELIPAREYLEQVVRKTIKIDNTGRNDPCPCGSGKKYKRCHGR